MYAAILRQLPDDMRMTMLELVETVEGNMRAELAVRREDFDKLQGTVAELAEAQKRTEERLERLEHIVAELATAQRRTEEALYKLIERVDKMDVTVSWLRGDQLERAHGRFGSFLRRVRVVPFYEIEPQLDERLPDEVVDDLRQLDLIVRGEQKGQPERRELWLAVEVSAVIDLSDVERARRRAAALRRAGYRAAAVAAGETHLAEAELSATAVGVAMVEDGTVLYLDEALRAAEAG